MSQQMRVRFYTNREDMYRDVETMISQRWMLQRITTLANGSYEAEFVRVATKAAMPATR